MNENIGDLIVPGLHLSVTRQTRVKKTFQLQFQNIYLKKPLSERLVATTSEIVNSLVLITRSYNYIVIVAESFERSYSNKKADKTKQDLYHVVLPVKTRSRKVVVIHVGFESWNSVKVVFHPFPNVAHRIITPARGLRIEIHRLEKKRSHKNDSNNYRASRFKTIMINKATLS